MIRNRRQPILIFLMPMMAFLCLPSPDPDRSPRSLSLIEEGVQLGKRMKVVRSLEEYRAWRNSLPKGERVGFFPTMGCLHEGHLDLAKYCREKCDHVVSSIFVNPKQFAAHEDLGTYPRQQEEDLRRLEEVGVDVVFLPTEEVMYPEGYDTYVECDVGTGRNEGAVRPHFFRGVATVCCKLFIMMNPHVVAFGQKDAQQCVVIQHMVRDLNFDIEVVIAPTRREEDGLAMSSRNKYLTEEERPRATVIYRALCAGRERIGAGEQTGAEVSEAMAKVLAEEPLLTVQYASVLHRSTLLDAGDLSDHDEVLIAIAGVLGKTRLIDNMPVAIPKH